MKDRIRILLVFFCCFLLTSCLTPPHSFIPQKTEMVYELQQEKDSAFLMQVRSAGQEEFASFHLREQALFLVRGTPEGREEAQFLEQPLTTGKSWKWSTGTATVLAIEPVQVPMGSFQAVPVEYQRNAQFQGKMVSITERIWFVRHLGWIRIEQKIDGKLFALQELIRCDPPSENSSVSGKGLDYFPLDLHRSWTFEKKSEFEAGKE